jgi:hypothetical protein
MNIPIHIEWGKNANPHDRRDTAVPCRIMRPAGLAFARESCHNPVGTITMICKGVAMPPARTAKPGRAAPA